MNEVIKDGDLDRLKSVLNKEFINEYVQTINWSHLKNANSIILIISDKKTEDKDYIPEQICIEISLKKSVFIIYILEKRNQTFHKKISSFGYSLPKIKKNITPENYNKTRRIDSIVKNLLPNYTEKSLSFAVLNINLFSNIFLKYLNHEK